MKTFQEHQKVKVFKSILTRENDLQKDENDAPFVYHCYFNGKEAESASQAAFTPFITVNQQTVTTETLWAGVKDVDASTV